MQTGRRRHITRPLDPPLVTPARCAMTGNGSWNATLRRRRKASGSSRARHLSRRLGIHDTPKHGIWLNRYEYELRTLAQQCLGRRIPDARFATRPGDLLAQQTKCPHKTDQLAVHHRRCPRQTLATLPTISTLTGYCCARAPARAVRRSAGLREFKTKQARRTWHPAGLLVIESIPGGRAAI